MKPKPPAVHQEFIDELPAVLVLNSLLSRTNKDLMKLGMNMRQIQKLRSPQAMIDAEVYDAKRTLARHPQQP